MALAAGLMPLLPANPLSRATTPSPPPARLKPFDKPEKCLYTAVAGYLPLKDEADKLGQ